MSNDNKTKIIDRIKKLFAHANSAKAIGSLSEAETALVKARQLLVAHNLSKSAIDGKSFERKTDFGVVRCEAFYGDVKSDGTWDMYLLHVLAQNNLCDVIFYKNDASADVIGREENVEVVLYLYDTCKRAIKRIANETFNAKRKEIAEDFDIKTSKVEGDRLPYRKVYVRQFLTGAVQGLQSKFDREREQAIQRQKRREAEQRIRNAMLLEGIDVDNTQIDEKDVVDDIAKHNDAVTELEEMTIDAQQEIDDFLDEQDQQYDQEKKRSRRRTSGFDDGYEVGDSFDAVKGITSGGNTATKFLGDGGKN